MIKFITGEPALLVDKWLVIGDLHIGIEEKLEEKGINVGNLSVKMGKEARRLFEESKAEAIVLLGDVKESIGYPTRLGYAYLKDFFRELEGVEVKIVKGNHDAHIKDVLSLIGVECDVEKELITKDAALMHGHAYPSKEALEKKYLIIGHGHAAYAPPGGSTEKVWVILEARSKKKLILLPAFNPMIAGSNVRNWDADIGIIRAGSFNLQKAKIYNLDGELLGLLGDLSKQG